MKVIMVYSYTDRSESVCGEGDARLDINNTVVDIARKCPTLGEIKKIEESLCSYPFNSIVGATRKEVADMKAETILEKKPKKRGRLRKMKYTTDPDESTFYVC